MKWLSREVKTWNYKKEYVPLMQGMMCRYNLIKYHLESLKICLYVKKDHNRAHTFLSNLIKECCDFQ